MATLEIHETGRPARRIRIGHDQPVMFGADPHCDVQVAGEGISPYHCRFAWNGTRFKVYSTPDSKFVEVNGSKVVSKGVLPGDEIGLGSCRIFLLSAVDDGPDHGEKTVIQAPPTARAFPPEADSIADRPKPVAAKPVAGPAPRKKKPKRSLLEDFDPSMLGDDDSPPADAARSAEPLLARSTSATPKPATKRRWPWLKPSLDQAPGDDRVFTSPVVIGLGATFVVLSLLSVLLWRAIGHADALRRYNFATESFERGDFPAAIKGFDAYLAAEPLGPRAGKADVYRALSRVKQHTGTVGASWTNALKESEAMVRDVGDREEYRDVSVDLAGEVLKTVEGFLDRAEARADPKELELADQARGLFEQVAGQASGPMLDRTKVAAKFDLARASIAKARDKAAAVALMDQALKDRKPAEFYQARRGLVARHPDLAEDPTIAKRLGLANDQIRDSVRFDPSTVPPEVEPRVETLGPPTSLVLRSSPMREPVPSAPAAFAVVDGLAWGLDAATGAPLWQRPVGIWTAFDPVRVAIGGGSVLLFDSRSSDLISLDARSGKLRWRQALDGVPAGPPLVVGELAYQAILDGRLILVDLATGERRGTLDLGRPVTRSPVLGESGERIYLLGLDDVAFAIDVDPVRCSSVIFLGHRAGSIPCTPARAGRFFVVAENHELERGRWRIYLMSPDGLSLRLAQEIPIDGWTMSTPAAAGPVIWSATDREELVAYAIGRYTDKQPFKPVARLAPSATSRGPAFLMVRDERELIVGSSFSARYDLDVERGVLRSAWTLREAGLASAMPQSIGDRLVFVQQAGEQGDGAAIAWGVSQSTGLVDWKTGLGHPWPTAWSGDETADRLTSLDAQGKPRSLSVDAARGGGIVVGELPTATSVPLVDDRDLVIRFRQDEAMVARIGVDRVTIQPSSGEPREVDLPTPLATRPLVVGPNLVVPGSDGRIYWVSVDSGSTAAEPFIPPFDRSNPIRWLPPARVDGQGFVIAERSGKLRKMAVDDSTAPRLSSTAERKLDQPIDLPPASTGGAVIVASADGKVRSFSGRDLAPLGSWPLEGPPTLPPVEVGGLVVVVDSAGQVLAFGPDGRRAWTGRLADPLVAGPPAAQGGMLLFVSRSGRLESLSTADGRPGESLNLDVLPGGGPIAVGPRVALPTGRGAIRLLAQPGGPDPNSPRGNSP